MNHGARSARTHGFIVELIGSAAMQNSETTYLRLMRIDEPNDAYRLSHKKMKLMAVQDHSRPIQIYFWQIPPIGVFMVGKSTASVAVTASHHSRDSIWQLAKKKRNIPESSRSLQKLSWNHFCENPTRRSLTTSSYQIVEMGDSLVPWSGHVVSVAWAKHAQDQLLQLQGPQSLWKWHEWSYPQKRPQFSVSCRWDRTIFASYIYYNALHDMSDWQNHGLVSIVDTPSCPSLLFGL